MPRLLPIFPSRKLLFMLAGLFTFSIANADDASI
jgi:hypothetical protein